MHARRYQLNRGQLVTKWCSIGRRDWMLKNFAAIGRGVNEWKRQRNTIDCCSRGMVLSVCWFVAFISWDRILLGEWVSGGRLVCVLTCTDMSCMCGIYLRNAVPPFECVSRECVKDGRDRLSAVFVEFCFEIDWIFGVTWTSSVAEWVSTKRSTLIESLNRPVLF